MTVMPEAPALRLLIEQVRYGAAQETAKVDAKVDTHERVCAERYSHIIEALSDMRRDIGALVASNTIRQQSSSKSAWSLNWKAWGVVGSVFLLLISAIAWETGQLYSLEPLRAAVMAKH